MYAFILRFQNRFMIPTMLQIGGCAFMVMAPAFSMNAILSYGWTTGLAACVLFFFGTVWVLGFSWSIQTHARKINLEGRAQTVATRKSAVELRKSAVGAFSSKGATEDAVGAFSSKNALKSAVDGGK